MAASAIAPGLDYRHKLILAPMVRISSLPTRLLSLDYGADIVYSEENIDYKLLQCKRIENDMLGTVDFVWNDGTVVFRTHPCEKDRLVFQMGTSNAQRALKVAKLVENDVAAIDVNMGCPKEFSIKGGMGAALLTQPDKVKEILVALVEGLSIPVTCKIRILPKLDDTLALVRLIESTGVAALGVHGRTRDERSRHPNHNDIIKIVTETIKIPVIANGGSNEISCYGDILKFKENTGASSVMLARAAQWNPSIFRREGGLVAVDDVIRAYLKYAVEFDNSASNTKYCVQQLLHEQLDTSRGRALQGSANVREVCALWGMLPYYDEVVASRQEQEMEKKRLLEDTSGTHSGVKKRKLDDGSELHEMPFKYHRKEYPDNNRGPKLILYEYTVHKRIHKPLYTTTENKEVRTFYSRVTVDGSHYATSLWDKSKKCAEQSAAVVCLHVLGLHDGRRDTPSALSHVATDERKCTQLNGRSRQERERESDPLGHEDHIANHSTEPSGNSEDDRHVVKGIDNVSCCEPCESGTNVDPGDKTSVLPSLPVDGSTEMQTENNVDRPPRETTVSEIDKNDLDLPIHSDRR